MPTILQPPGRFLAYSNGIVATVDGIEIEPNRVYEASRRPGPIVEASCWAHARRKFFDLAR